MPSDTTLVMDFFGRQDEARRNTRRLILLFALAVVSIIAAIYLTAAVIFSIAEAQEPGGSSLFAAPLWSPQLLLMIAIGTIVVIIASSGWKIASLNDGGSAVARMFGGRLLNADTVDSKERRLLNIVEEMAIASGTPVPPVYLLDDEPGINAFAAGYSPDDAVIGVTEGCLQRLNRDELQGVIAHEFSHILNGDMRMNIRLMGVLFGILAISTIGYIVLRIAIPSGHARHRSSRERKGGGAVLAIMAFGAAVWLIGWIGVFFGRLIKAAVSRQREFLADAAAVQFTRNPHGIAGALRKIGGLEKGSRIDNAHAEEASHLFFGQALSKSWFSAMSTHPPLPERLQRIDPSGAAPSPTTTAAGSGGDDLEIVSGFSGGQAATAAAAGGTLDLSAVEPGDLSNLHTSAEAPHNVPLTPASATRHVGLLDTEHIDYAKTLRAAIPDDIEAAIREPFSARAVLFALLFDRYDELTRQRQSDYLQRLADAPVYAETLRVLPAIFELPPHYRLPLAELTLPALRRMSGNQYHEFQDHVEALITMDDKVDLFEFALRHVLYENLDPVHTQSARKPRFDRTLIQCRKELNVLLSAFADAGGGSDADEQAAFEAAAAHFADRRVTLQRVASRDVRLHEVDEALDKLRRLRMPDRRLLIEAAATSIARDGLVSLREADLLRAVAASLQCPMAPILAGQAA